MPGPGPELGPWKQNFIEVGTETGTKKQNFTGSGMGPAQDGTKWNFTGLEKDRDQKIKLCQDQNRDRD